jgi:peptidyl-prolyl cis-trans isomerase SurA
MKPSLNSLACALISTALLGAAGTGRAQTLPTSSIDGIAAVVDENVILRSELERAVNNISARYANQPRQLPPRDILEKQVLNRLVLMQLQLARAEDSGIRIADAEVQQAVGNIAKQNNLSVEQLRQQLANDGLGFGEFVANLKDEMTVQRLRQRYMQSSVQISEAEIDQLLAGQSLSGSELHLANIQINLGEDATPDQIMEAKTRIEEIRSLIARGEIDFRSAAVRYSQAQNALDGGEIGWRSADSIPPAFVNILRGMKPGEITAPVRGPSGFQIVQLIETREAQAQMVTQYRASHLMVRVSDLVSEEAARQKIEALRARIEGGEDFAKVAKEASDDTMTRNSGGDMGWFAADQWGGAVQQQITALADGELSQPFKSDIGFHLIKRIGTREQDLTSENQRSRAREVIGQRKGEEAYERFLRQLRSDAYVETRLGGA